MRLVLAPHQPSPPRRARRWITLISWVAAVVVPVVAGGIIGGQLGGLVTAVLIVPWLHHLIGTLPPPASTRAVPPRIRRADNDLDALVAVSHRGRHDSAA